MNFCSVNNEIQLNFKRWRVNRDVSLKNYKTKKKNKKIPIK